MLRAVQTQPDPDFLQTLEQYEEAIHKKSVAVHVGSHNGRTIIKEVPKWNLLLRLVCWVQGARNRREFHGQMLTTLKDEGTDSAFRARVYKAITLRPTAVFSSGECRQIMRNKASYFRPLPEDCRVQIYDPSSINPVHRIRAADPRPLSEKMKTLKDALPNVSAFQAKNFLSDFYLELINGNCDPASIDAFETFRRELFQHFYDTRQSDDFFRIDHDAGRAALKAIRHSTPADQFSDTLCRLCTQIPTCASFLRDVAYNTINHATNDDPPIHGHPNSQVTEDELELARLIAETPQLKVLLKINDTLDFTTVRKQLHTEIQTGLAAIPDFKKLQDALKTLDVSQIAREREYKIPEDQLSVIVPARKVLLDLQLSVGRRWHDSVLLQEDSWPTPEDFETYKKLLEIDQLSCPQIYKAQRQWLIDKHNATPLHPHEVIEGAGPTGLLLALTQFQEGMNVSVLEKRSTQYERVQVVRLDPKWMNMLKFYLGPRYFELFSSQQGEHGRIGKGIIREDGFGEITTKELEDALHMELSELISLSPPGLQRLAEHELVSVREPQQTGEKYKVVIKKANDEQAQQETIDDVDVLIAAGGVNSPTMLRELTSMSVTTEKFYSVCSWESPKLKNPELSTFEDFRGKLIVDQTFIDSFQQELADELAEGDFSWLEDNPKGTEKHDVLQELIKPDSPAMIKFAQSVRGEFLQTRCFDNKGLIYIGMEMPDAYTQLYAEGVLSGIKLSGKVSEHFQNFFIQAWLTTVAKAYKLDQKVNLDKSYMKSKFARLIGVQQNRLRDHVEVKKKNDAELLVTAAGDAAVSPHFMRYSGLTGAREYILHLEELTASMTDPETAKTRNQALRVFSEKAEKTTEYVLNRGQNFLKRRSPVIRNPKPQ